MAAEQSAQGVDNSRMVLVVDDDEDIRDAMVDILSDEGFDVRVATDGKQALEMLVTTRPRLIMLDWMMPGMSGSQVLAALREDVALSSIPVVVLTASHRREVAASGTRVLQKPISIDALVEVVQEYCERGL